MLNGRSLLRCLGLIVAYAASRPVAIALSWGQMFNLRLPPLLLAIVVAAPATLAGRLASQGDYARAGQVAIAEMFVILIASVMSTQRTLD